MKEAERLLSIFFRLQSGERLSKSELAREYQVSEKSIQRDFAFLSHFLLSMPDFGEELLYDTKTHQRYLQKTSRFNKKDILVISKILLENRAFNKTENNTLLDGLLEFLNKDDRQAVYEIIASERLNYAELSDATNKIDKIWEFSEFIRQSQMVEFDYTSPYREGVKPHTALFVSLYYDDHYFYLKGFDVDKQKYLDFRLDRIIAWRRSNAKKPIISYRDKFRDGEVRNYKIDAFTGEQISLRIRYRQDPTIILDRFPNSKILNQSGKEVEIQIDTQYTFGLKRYLISQLDNLIVLSPQYLINDIREILEKMQKNYF